LRAEGTSIARENERHQRKRPWRSFSWATLVPCAGRRPAPQPAPSCQWAVCSVRSPLLRGSVRIVSLRDLRCSAFFAW